ncbi:MAG TPA: MBL fold metallo-hydrolase [Acidobacteriaceae bacterium]
MTMLKRAEKRDRKFQNPVPTQVGGFSTIFKALPLFLTNKEEKSPKEPLGPFHTDAKVYATLPASGLRVTWFGHSSILLEIDGVRVLIDPVWDERASPVQWAGPKRFFEPTLPLEEMPAIDVVLVSHDHYDHLGKTTIQGLAKLKTLAKAQWVTSLCVGKLLQEFGVAAERIVELDWTQTVSVAGGACSITSAPSRHFSGRGLLNRFETLWASFVIKGREHAVYFGADSGFWEGFEEIGAAYGPFDLTMLEIGASNELWKAIHMGPDGAAQAYAALGGPERAGLLMPIHWGLFDLALHGWRQPMERLGEIAAERGWRLFAPEPGLPTEVAAVQSDWWKARKTAADRVVAFS